MAYFGGVGLARALRSTGAQRLLGVDRHAVSGWVTVSTTELDATPSLAWLRAQRPVQTIDGSLLVYDENRGRGTGG